MTPPGLVTRAPRFSAADAVRFATDLEPPPSERARSVPEVAIP
jgi:hypothetical protein